MNRTVACMTAGLALLGAAARADEPASPKTPAEILAKVREGTGRDALPDGGVQLTGSSTFLGSKETCALTMTRSSFVLDQTGDIPMTRGFGSAGPWMIDIGGEVRTLQLGDAEEGRILRAALTGCWMDDPSCETFIWGVDEKRANENRVYLTFTLKDGLSAGDISIDRKTWRPAEWTIRTGSHADVITFEGELAVGGAWLPRKLTLAGQSSTAEYTFEKAEPAPQFFRSPYEPASFTPSDVVFDPAVPALLDSRKANTGHCLVKVDIDGKDGWFIFDTGAGSTVIDAAFSDAAGLKPFGEVQAVGVGGSVGASFVRAKALRVGPATQSGALMTRLDLSAIAKAMGTRVDGVLGFNLMHRAVTRLSTQNWTVSVYDPARFDETAKELGWDDLKWLPMAVYERHACIEASFEGHTGWFTLDTGAGAQPLSMHAPAVKAFNLLEGRDLRDAKAGGVGGQVPMKLGSLAWLEIGGRREEKVPAMFALEEKGAFADPFTAGHLSIRQLGPRDVIFDYGRNRIAFPPHPHPHPQ